MPRLTPSTRMALMTLRFFAGIALVLASTLAAAQGGARAPLSQITTRPERTEFRETSRYEDVVKFMNAVAEAAPETVRLTTFAKTHEGRALPLAVVGAPAATADAVRRTGKLRVFIQGNIH